MKLYDQITHADEIHLMPPDAVYSPFKDDGVLERGVEALQRATRVNIQNVADYAVEHSTLNGRMPDVANGRPPWPIVWAEYRLQGADYGVLTITDDAPDGQGILDQVHAVFVEQPFRGKKAIFYLARIETRIDERGNPVPVDDGGAEYRLIGHVPREAKQPLHDNIVNTATGAAHVMQLAITFANCKNVFLQEHHTPPKVARKRAKAGKPVGTSYKTLLIDPMREVLKTEGNVEKNGLKKALHICRGHFATYTNDKPLFGKVTGTFWKPMHVRGNAKLGKIEKDYRVLGKH